MKTARLAFNGTLVLMHFPDNVVDLKVGKRTYRLEYCRHTGPHFFFKNDRPYYPSKNAPVWKAFNQWMKDNERL